MKTEVSVTIGVDATGLVRVIRLAGELDVATVAEVEASFQTRLMTESDLIIDLSELSFMDSCGVRALVRLRAQALAEGWALRVRAANGIVRKVLRMTGVDTILTMEP